MLACSALLHAAACAVAPAREAHAIVPGQSTDHSSSNCASNCGALELRRDLATEDGQAAWAAYLKGVYGEPVVNTSIITGFDFFYRQSPLLSGAPKDASVRACIEQWEAGSGVMVAQGAAWWSALGCRCPTCAGASTPEQQVSSFGLWVNRRPARSLLLSSTRLEVTRVPSNLEVAPTHNGAWSLWFYATRGSGVFLDLDALRAMGGRFVQVSDRDALDFFDAARMTPKDIDADVNRYMLEHDIRVLVYDRSMAALGAPRAEVVVRLDANLFPGANYSTMACPLPDSLLSAGLTQPRACKCDAANQQRLACSEGSVADGGHPLLPLDSEFVDATIQPAAKPAALCAADTLRPRTILGEYGPTADEPLVSIRSNCSAVAAGEMFRTPYASNVAFHDAPSKATGSKADTCQWTNVAANRAWLSAVEATDAAFKMSCYYGRVYPGIATGARVNASQLDYFWSHVPTLGATSVLGVSAISIMANAPSGACPMPDRSLWMVKEDAALHPARLSCADVSACRCENAECAPRLAADNDVTSSFSSSWSCAVAAMSSAPAFPGFFAHRSDKDAIRRVPSHSSWVSKAAATNRHVADNTWVEVMRIARMDDRFGAPAADSPFESEMALVGQVWFWVARGSGVWLNVGRSLVMRGPQPVASRTAVELSAGPVTTNPTCREARSRGYDTIQLLRSFGMTNELIDCRGAARPDWNVTYEPGCPPPHVELRAGLPTPRDAPALEGVEGSFAACACDRSYDFANCYGSPSKRDDLLRRNISNIDVADTTTAVAPLEPAKEIGTGAASSVNASAEYTSCVRVAEQLNDNVSAPFEGFDSTGIWARSLDDLVALVENSPPERLEHQVLGRWLRAGRCPTVDESSTSTDTPPWCPGQGNEAHGSFHFNSSLLRRYSFSFLNQGLCWRRTAASGEEEPTSLQTEDIFNSVYALDHIMGGILSLPHRLVNRAMCYFPRDAGTCLRSRCGCGTYVDNATVDKPYLPGDSTTRGASNLAEFTNASDAAVESYLENYWDGNQTWEGLMPSMSADVYARVGQKQLAWDQVRLPGGSDDLADIVPGWKSGYNEILVQPWFGVQHAEVPIDAWFYTSSSSSEAQTRHNRRFMESVARAYRHASGRDLPVVKLDARECRRRPFSCE